MPAVLRFALFTLLFVGISSSPASPGQEAGTGAFVTLNIAMQSDAGEILNELRQAGMTPERTTLLLQEVIIPNEGPGVADQLASKLGHSVCKAVSFPWTKTTSVGLAILSPEPLRDCETIALKRFQLAFRTRTRIAMTAMAGSTRVYNLHLDTRINLAQRLEQMQPVLDHASRSDSPVIIAGDFNSNPYRWVGSALPLRFGESQAAGVKRRMTEAGYTTPLNGAATHDFLGMTLDWIYTRGIASPSATIHPLRFSDHHAILLRMPPSAPLASSH